MLKKLLVSSLFSIYSASAFTHGGIDHRQAHVVHTPQEHEKVILKSISAEYKMSIEPIFKNKCFDCHSGQTAYPWYYQIPGIHGLMNSHIEEARSHLDFSKGYPFISHVKPIEDLKAIQKSVEENEMPPFYYTILHKNSRLTDQERKLVRDWVLLSVKKL